MFVKGFETPHSLMEFSFTELEIFSKNLKIIDLMVVAGAAFVPSAFYGRLHQHQQQQHQQQQQQHRDTKGKKKQTKTVF